MTVVVAQRSTTTTLTTSANPAGFGYPVTYTIAIDSPTATGTATITDWPVSGGSSTLGTCTVANGRCTITTNALTNETHPLYADFSGDGNPLASVSAGATLEGDGVVRFTDGAGLLFQGTATATNGGIDLRSGATLTAGASASAPAWLSSSASP